MAGFEGEGLSSFNEVPLPITQSHLHLLPPSSWRKRLEKGGTGSERGKQQRLSGPEGTK